MSKRISFSTLIFLFHHSFVFPFPFAVIYVSHRAQLGLNPHISFTIHLSLYSLSFLDMSFEKFLFQILFSPSPSIFHAHLFRLFRIFIFVCLYLCFLLLISYSISVFYSSSFSPFPPSNCQTQLANYIIENSFNSAKSTFIQIFYF